MDENTYFLGLKKETRGLAYLTPEKVQLALKARPSIATKEPVQQICIIFFNFFCIWTEHMVCIVEAVPVILSNQKKEIAWRQIQVGCCKKKQI